MRRSEQREHIFKLLFMTQFNSENEMSDQVSMYFDTLGELEEKDQEAIQNKYQHILEHLDEIDQILNEYSRGWKTTRMNRVDLTALRLAVYEMKMDEEVPVGVAINEAVELAKLFGGEDSGSFVNGILGKIASGKKDSGEEHKKPRRQTHSAKIIIRSSKKDGKASKDQKNQGISGKENHTGLGLWEIRQILKKNNNVNLYTNKNEKYFFSGPDQSICQEYVYTGFYSAEDLCKGRSFQLQISYQWTHLFFIER